VVHIFSHIRQTYVVTMVTVNDKEVNIATDRPSRWLTEHELDEAALSTAMRKVGVEQAII
jgi:adenine-specific DNA glycosylase